MSKILPITRAIMRRIHRILKVRRGEEEEVFSENGVEAEGIRVLALNKTT